MDKQTFFWRREQLVLAGFRDDEAVALAASDGVDLHRALEMLKAGCPSALVLKILA